MTAPVVKPSLAARYSKFIGALLGAAVSGLAALGSAQLFSGQTSHNLIVISGVLTGLTAPIGALLAPENKKAFDEGEQEGETQAEHYASVLDEIATLRDKLVDLGIVTLPGVPSPGVLTLPSGWPPIPPFPTPPTNMTTAELPAGTKGPDSAEWTPPATPLGIQEPPLPQ